MSDEQTKTYIKTIIDETIAGTGYIYHILTGPGGTGKTTFLKSIVDDYILQKKKVVVICPTHKSIRNIDPGKYPCKTYCSFFNCNFDILNQDDDLECTIKCCKDKTHRSLPTTIKCLEENGKYIEESIDLLIAEECSMFTHNFFKLLSRYTGIKVILFIGDSNQIPPINNDCKSCKDCSFSIFNTNIPKSYFKEQKRHDNKINEKLQSFIKLVSQSESITKAKLTTVLEMLFDVVPLDQLTPIVSPIITYNVKRAELINFLLLNGRMDIRVGDYITIEKGSNDILPPGSIAMVKNIQDEEYVCYQLMKEFKFRIYTLSVNNAGTELDHIITTIHPDFREYYTTYCKRYREGLPKQLKYMVNNLIKEHLTVFNYAYAITAHKAQGQTYLTSYIDYKNILLCKDMEITVKLLYSSISRAKTNIFLVSVPTYFKAPKEGLIISKDFLTVIT